MGVPDVSVTAIIIGGIASVIGMSFSKLAENWGADRREAAKQRREDDRDARAECERLRERNSRLEAQLGALQAVCMARGIPLPPLLPSGDDT